MQLFGLIGNQLDGSPSPGIYNAVFRKWGRQSRYLPFQIERRYLKNLLLTMKLVDGYGLNVTAPFKTAVLPWLDALDASARRAGAVNTIVRRGGRFIGTNTDGLGFLQALRHTQRLSPRGRRVVLIGAGGAAHGIAAALAGADPKSIVVLNRHPRRAAAMIRHLRKSFPKVEWSAGGLRRGLLDRILPQTDLLVQTTSALLKLPLTLLPRKAVVCEIIYWPLQTPLLRHARRLGLKTLDGLWMLIHQANLNLKLWCGRTEDVHWLRRTGRYHLGKLSHAVR